MRFARFLAYALIDMLDIIDPGPFVTPALVVALDGWVNAGSAGTLAAAAVAPDRQVVARFDPDRLYDYRMMRPTVDFMDGVIAGIEWPDLAVFRTTVGGRDLLVLTGPEPNWNWRELSTTLIAACRSWGVVEFIGIGGVPWAAPHTRPITVMSTASSSERLQRWPDQPEGLLRVPAAAVTAIDHEVAMAGIPTIGFWARVPNYVGSAFPAAAVVLVERLSSHLGIPFDLDDLQRQVSEHLLQVEAIIDQRPDVRSMVEQLEQVYDSTTGVTGEDLAAEIERFLRDQR
jgi:hypothetical protein